MERYFCIVANGHAAPIPRQSDDLVKAKAIAWECYTYDQATGNPEAEDYQYRRGDHIAYSADRDGRPTQVLCAWCHNALVIEEGTYCASCSR